MGIETLHTLPHLGSYDISVPTHCSQYAINQPYQSRWPHRVVPHWKTSEFLTILLYSLERDSLHRLSRHLGLASFSDHLALVSSSVETQVIPVPVGHQWSPTCGPSWAQTGVRRPSVTPCNCRNKKYKYSLSMCNVKAHILPKADNKLSPLT